MTSWIEYNHILLNNFWDLAKQPFLHKLYRIPTSICKQHPNFRSTFIALATLVITISTAIRIKNNKNFGSYIRAIFDISCYYNFNPCGIFEKMTSFSPILNQDLEQGKLMAAVNSRK